MFLCHIVFFFFKKKSAYEMRISYWSSDVCSSDLHIVAPQVSGAYKVDISRGRNIGRVSSEWYSRPDDEKFLFLDDLYENVRRRADRARTRIVESRDVRVEASMDNAERLSLKIGRAHV